MDFSTTSSDTLKDPKGYISDSNQGSGISIRGGEMRESAKEGKRDW
jgi:hypothetical protein